MTSADEPSLADGHNTDAIVLNDILPNVDHGMHGMIKTKSDYDKKSTHTIMTDKGHQTRAKHDKRKIALPFSVSLEDK